MDEGLPHPLPAGLVDVQRIGLFDLLPARIERVGHGQEHGDTFLIAFQGQREGRPAHCLVVHIVHGLKDSRFVQCSQRPAKKASTSSRTAPAMA